MNNNEIKKTTEPDRPMDAEEYSTLKFEKAKESGEKYFKEANRNKLQIYTGGKALPNFVKSIDCTDVMEMELPEGASIGIPMVKTERVSFEKVSKTITPSPQLEGICPPWIDFNPHPEIVEINKPVIHHRNGKIFHPYYGVFGKDDRKTYKPNGYPWSCIGKLLITDDLSKPYYPVCGTAALVGRNVLLTAAHLIPWDSPVIKAYFIPACYNGGSTLGKDVGSFVSYAMGYKTEKDDVGGRDMAVLHLVTPLGDQCGYFGYKTYNSDWEDKPWWSIAGYPMVTDGGWSPSKQRWFPILDDDESIGSNIDELEFEADCSSGDSGAPIFANWGKKYYVIGTVSGGQDNIFENTNLGAGGGAMAGLIAMARLLWAPIP